MNDLPQSLPEPGDSARDAEIAELRAELLEARRELGVVRGRNHDLQDQLISQQRRSEYLARQLATMTRTWPYRIGRLVTLPLRVAKRLFRRR